MTGLFELPVTGSVSAAASGPGAVPGPTDQEELQRRQARAAELAAERELRIAELLADLNPQQRAAVTHRGAPLLVVAGAGSGKTRVLTRRIAYLLATEVARPGEIVAITFTNKAAAEMKERVAAAVGPRARAMWVSTFHSLCVRVLRAEAAHLGLKSSFTIYDATDSQRLIGMIANGLDIDTRRNSPRALATAVSALKNELVGVEQAMQQAESDYDTLVAAVYRGYQQRLTTASALDFDDLIMRTVTLLHDFPAVAEHYHRRFRHVLVDEYQDTNHAQYELVRALVGGDAPDPATAQPPPAELVVVGDADQSIYAFRGASIRNIVEFEKDYPNARTVLLEQNYRSTQTILSAANAVIARDPARRPKNLWTDAGAGEKIVGYVGDDEYDEARFIGQEIDALVDAGAARYSDVAVFYRTNSASRAIEDIFVRTGMPYRIVGGVRFYERKEVKDALAYLRAVINPDDEVSIRRVLNTPKRGIGERAEATVALHAERERISFADALRQARQIDLLATRSAVAIAGFVELLDGLNRTLDEGADPAELLSAALDRSGYRAELDGSDDPQDASRLENLDQLVSVLRDQAEAVQLSAEQAAIGAGGTAEEAAMSARELLWAVLEQLALVADADAVPDSTEGVVTLMTLHTAKGLEFPVVFVTGWEDGIFPHQRSLGDEQQLAEERRLAYVGITRARQRLYVSRAVQRSSWGNQAANPASRFLDDIPEALVDWRRVVEAPQRFVDRRGGWPWEDDFNQDTGSGSTSRGSGWGQTVGRRSAPVTATRFGTPRGRPGGGAPRPTLHLAVGDRVSHDKYGLGTVREVGGAGQFASAVIDFGSSGTVRLMLVGTVPMVKL